ncbi:hypothetical protein DPMN_118814 [Dreissena polymorpha]|uniref:Uncharacterized protein n=1 Tax=Dreissena polymorpha TaxID=45954 RepID=A0A9D4JM35_DREPO|nr:hypothetical protein DPMN_118814 [Dreissena polymorpha]
MRCKINVTGTLFEFDRNVLKNFPHHTLVDLFPPEEFVGKPRGSIRRSFGGNVRRHLRVLPDRGAPYADYGVPSCVSPRTGVLEGPCRRYADLLFF